MLQEYKKTLRETTSDIRRIENRIKTIKETLQNASSSKVAVSKTIDLPEVLSGLECDLEIYKAAASDLRFAISWMKKGFQPNAHYRGIERNDAYYVMRSYDPSIIERYIANKESSELYHDVEEGLYGNQEEKEERQRIVFEEKLTREMAELLDKVKAKLTKKEKDILLLLEQEKPQSEIAKMVGVSQQAVSKTIKKIKKKLLELGIEREDL